MFIFNGELCYFQTNQTNYERSCFVYFSFMQNGCASDLQVHYRFTGLIFLSFFSFAINKCDNNNIQNAVLCMNM